MIVGQFLSTFNLLAVTNSLPVKSLREAHRACQANPGKLLNASWRQRTTGHLGGELLKIMTALRSCPCLTKGAAWFTDLDRPGVQVMFDNLTSISPHAKAAEYRTRREQSQAFAHSRTCRRYPRPVCQDTRQTHGAGLWYRWERPERLWSN